MAGEMLPRFPGDAYGAPEQADMQRLTAAKIGFPTPSEPGMRRDAIPGAPNPLGIRQAANAEAREIAVSNKPLILTEQVIAQGFWQALRTCGLSSVDTNLIQGNTRAKPVNISGRFVVTPANPSGAQLASANLIAQANFAPGAYPAIPYTEPFSEEYQTGIVQGFGPTVKARIRPSEILIIDTLGITTFSRAAEYELVWILTYGLSKGAAPNAQPNLANLLIPGRRGWPFGTADRPAVLEGMSRLAPQQGSTKSGETDVYLAVNFSPASPGAGASYTPWPHYVQITLRGWRVQVGKDGLALATNVGGGTMDANGGF